MTARILLKLGLLTILPLVLGSSALLLVVPGFLVRSFEGGLEQALSEKARLVETSLRDKPPEQHQDLVADLARRAKARITVIAPQGRVLADSDADPASMENHANRPEFVEALAGQVAVRRRFSSTLSTDSLYVAAPMEGGGAVRLALPLDHVNALASENRNTIMGLIAMIVVPLILVTAWSAKRISGQLSQIVAMSDHIADGNFEIRAPDHRRGDLRELDDLSSSLQAAAWKLRATFNQLQEERSRFAAAINGIREGILVSNRKRRIVLFNPAIELMFPDEQLQFGGSLKQWRNQDVAAIFKRSIDTGQPYSTELAVREPKARSWRVSCAPIASRKGKVRAVAAVFHDITELERVDRMRRDFVINVSHELRTPLASITGYAETLMDGAIHDSKNNLRFIRILWKNARRLADLTSDLMTLSQIEVKAREFEFEQRSVAELLRAASDGIGPVLERSGLRLSVQPVKEGSVVACDHSAMQQILGNLLDNAAKYTPEGGHISMGAVERRGKLDFYVRDSGIGIAEEHIPRLFERFYRVDKARSRELGGTGLGLAIVKHLVQAHSGTTWVESTLGEGSTFWFSLPVRQAVPDAPDAASRLRPALSER